MSSYALALSPARSLVAADLLKLRRRRGLVAVSSLLTIGATVVTYAVMELLHVANTAKHGPAGGITNLGHVAFLATLLGAVVAAIVASSAAVGDLDAGVYRDLVVTGRSRLSLYLSRIPAGFLFLLPFVAAGYALAAVASVVFAGSKPAPGVGLLTTNGLWVLVEVAFYYLLAFGIACLVGSRAYTIGIVLAWRLALTPILASISALGIVRELVPGVGLQNLAPAAFGDAVRQGPAVGMTASAIAAVLLVWTVSALVAGAWRDTTRDA
jgi:ABC-type transport system involved in multi-copper enzyme maturation permease subunit